MSYTTQQSTLAFTQPLPHLSLGQVELPAPILPASIAVAYILLLLHRRFFRSPAVHVQDPNPKFEGKQSNDTKEGNIIYDEENIQLDHATISDCRRPPSWYVRWPLKALGAARCYQTNRQMMQLLNGRTLDANTIRNICLLQLGFATFAALLQYAGRQKRMMQKHQFLCTAWVAYALREALPVKDAITNGIWVGLTLVVIISGACAILPQYTLDNEQFRHLTLEEKAAVSPEYDQEDDSESVTDNVIGHMLTISLLLFLFAREFVPTHVWSWLTSQSMSVKLIVSIGVPVSLFGIRTALHQWYNIRQYSTPLGTAFSGSASVIRYRVPGFALDILFVSVILAEFFAFYLIVTFLISCVGFRYLILGQPSTQPSFRSQGGSLAAIFSVWVLAFYNRAYAKMVDRPRALVKIALCVLESVGLVMVIYIGIAAALFGYQQTRLV